jgi:hypothetical protein
MGTFLFDRVIFGPVKSRRLGVSLGINLVTTIAFIANAGGQTMKNGVSHACHRGRRFVKNWLPNFRI